jgi:hypothetical protein
VNPTKARRHQVLVLGAGPGARVRRARTRHGPESSGLVRTSPEERGLFSPVLLVIRASRDLNFQVDRPQGGPGSHS